MALSHLLSLILMNFYRSSNFMCAAAILNPHYYPSEIVITMAMAVCFYLSVMDEARDYHRRRVRESVTDIRQRNRHLLQ
jgi:hypothetical protein